MTAEDPKATDMDAALAGVAADLDSGVEITVPPDDTDPEAPVASADVVPLNPVPTEGGGQPPPPPADADADDDGDNGKHPDDPWLPEDCAVQALGVTEKANWYLDANQMLKPLAFGKHGRLEIMSLFGRRQDQLYQNWPVAKPRFDGTGSKKKIVGWQITGWASEQVQEDLIHDCGLYGPWNPTGAVRGIGSWASPDGELILHCGGELVIGPRLHKPGVIGDLRRGGHVYPAGAPLPSPPLEPCLDDADLEASAELLALMNAWNMARGSTDARLAFGWVACAFLAGAIKWRPVTWLTGRRNTGKSTFQRMIGHVMGDWVVEVAEATPAGIWQEIGYSSRAIAFDELEPGDNPARVRAIVQLARRMASGAMMLRGGQDHEGVSFTLRSCAQFSSIDVPALKPADLSRIVIIEFNRPTDHVEPKLDRTRLAEIGRRMLRRLRTEWPRWEATFDGYRNALAKVGHDGRGCDVFGTLLAAGDLALSAEPADARELGYWQEHLRPEALLEREGANEEDRAPLDHILTTASEVHREGQRRTIGKLLSDRVRGWQPGSPLDHADHDALQALGLKIEPRTAAGSSEVKLHLYVANSHQGLARVLQDTQWAGIPGGEGGWKRALRRLPGAEPARLRIGGVLLRATRLPIEQVLPDWTEVEDG